MKFIKKINKVLQKIREYSKSNLEIEIIRNERSLKRLKNELYDLQVDLPDDGGNAISDMYDKIERVESNLNRLKSKV